MLPWQYPVQQSFWQASAPPARKLPALEGDLTAHVAVIGGGYAGLSTAWHLARDGVSVVLLEAADIGHGGAGRNNGMVIPALTRAFPDDLRQRFGDERGERMARFIATSADYAFSRIRELGIECEAVQKGWIQPAHSPGRALLARQRAQQWQALGANVSYLEPSELEASSGAQGYHGGWIAHDGGHVHPLRLVRGLADAAISAGANVFTHSPAIHLARQTQGWLVKTPAGSVRAEKVIVATDAYADHLLPALQRSVVPVRFYQLATSVLPDAARAAVLPAGVAISDTRGDMRFARPTKDGRIVSGGVLALGACWQPRLKKHIRKRLQTMFPGIGDGWTFEYAWYGHVGITLDFLPHLHALGPGLLALTGFNGRGVALAIASGRMLAEAAQGRDANDLDIPLTEIKQIPFHGLVRRLATLELLRYRWRDQREV